MAENMMCKTQKANSQAFNDHYDKIFRQLADYFTDLDRYHLERYAERWAKEYSILQIEAITLHRYSLWYSFEGGRSVKQYALVFEYSGIQDPDAIDYGCQEFGLQPLESYPIDGEDPFITALKEIKHADQFASQGYHRLFDSSFVDNVYKDPNSIYREWASIPTEDLSFDYHKEWTYILRPSGSEDPFPNGVETGRYNTFVIYDRPVTENANRKRASNNVRELFPDKSRKRKTKRKLKEAKNA